MSDSGLPPESEGQLARVNRMLSAVRNINQLITREKDKDRLLEQSCRILVETQGFNSAFIQLCGPDPRFFAAGTPGAEAFQALDARLRQGEPVPCTAAALASQGVAVIETPWAVCPECPLVPEHRGSAAMAVKLEYAGKIHGVLSVSLPSGAPPDEDAKSLLTEAANDLAFALSAIEQDEKARKAEEQIRWLATFPTENPNPVLRVGLDARLLYANAAATPLLRKWGCPIGACLPGAEWEPLAKALRAGQGVENEIECEDRIYLLTWTPIPAAGYVNVYGRDITKRKRAEEALKLFRTLVDNSMDAVEVIDMRTGRFLDVNVQSCLDHGYSREEYLAMTVMDIDATVNPDAFPGLMEELRKAGAQTWEGIHRRKDGSTFPVEVNRRYVHLERDYMVAVVRDVTARKRAEEALRESEDRYRSLLELSPDAIFLNRGGKVVFINQAGLRLFGADRPEQMLGRSPLDFTHPDYHALVKERIRIQIEEGKAVPPIAEKYYRLDGTLVDVEVSAAPVTLRGETVIQVVLRDITGRKQLEEQFRQAQKMEAVGRLAGGVAHDFNNLLFVINGRAEMLLNRLAQDDPSRSSIELIRRTGVRAANLTRQLLAFSRRQVLQPQVLDLNAVITDMQKMLRRLIREDISLTTVLSPALRPTEADPGQIEQVLLNLVVNACDAMPEGGRLTIETANAELGEAYCRVVGGISPGPYVMMSVTDTGCGMDENVKAHLFEPFFTTKEQGKGTGLGLGTVYGIIRQSGGSLEVLSSPGQGVTFKVYLPQVQGAAAAAPRRSSVAALPARGTETVLLVEDEEGVRDLARDVLESNGYTVLPAGNGAEALRVQKQYTGRIHLVLTDVVMPRMNGPALVKKLRRRAPDIRVLFMSGYTDDAITDHDLRGRGIGFIQKPITPAELARKVREALDAEG